MKRETIEVDKEIIIPELEELAKTFIPHGRPWTKKEIAQLKLYYGRVPLRRLATALNRGAEATRKKADELGLRVVRV